MPKWALTAELRQKEPWGLAASLLTPAKIYTDPIHGDIYLNRLEQAFVDSPPFQRLRSVRQLGATHLVYPAATHTRFSHSLGALRAAQDLLDGVLDQRSGPRGARDLFQQWASDPKLYLRRVAEATVLVRLGALLHDYCHIPFGHSIEDELAILDPHDSNGERYDRLWAGADAFVTHRLELDIPLTEVFARPKSVDGTALADELRPLILSKEGEEAWKRISYPFAADIIGNTISADLIDYLQRDHYFTGLPLALGHRFLDAFYVTRDDQREYPKRMALRIARRRGEEREDTISELLKYLRYRYELSERALVHHGKLAADAMLGKSLQMWFDARWIETAMARQPSMSDVDAADIDAFRAELRSRDGADAEEAVTKAAVAALEDEFLRSGDDALLDRLAASASAGGDDARKAGVAELAKALLERRLFKRIGMASAPGEASRIHERWGAPDERRRLEQRIAEFAELSPRWRVVLWIPPPGMRLKAAGVLVDDMRKIRPFVDRERAQGRHRGEEISDSHEKLWAVSVFVSPDVTDLQRHVILGRVAEELEIEWNDGSLPTSIWDIAVRTVGDEERLTRGEESELRALEPAFWGGSAGSAEGATFADVLSEARRANDARTAEGEAAKPDEPEQGTIV